MGSDATRRHLRVTVVLAALGAATGALAAIVLSFLATRVAQTFEPDGRVVYYWAPNEFALVGAVGIPLLAWALMRRVPLWRAISEPALGGMIGMLVALASLPLTDALILQPACVIGGIIAAALRLRWLHRNLEIAPVRPGVRRDSVAAGN